MTGLIPSHSENWAALYSIAEAQAGHFTIEQAHEASISKAMLQYYLKNGRLQRLLRGVYRLHPFPYMRHEELVPLWLWTNQVGVYSHESALALHELSDVLPGKAHLKLPDAWRKRRLKVPSDTVLHYGENTEKQWMGPVPLTSVFETLKDCIADHISTEIVEDALSQVKRRGLISSAQATQLQNQLEQ